MTAITDYPLVIEMAMVPLKMMIFIDYFRLPGGMVYDMYNA